MNQTIYDLILIGIAAITTFLLRALPFLLFGGKHSMPSTVQKVSESLPPAIMAVLVVYCIKDSISSPGSGTIATGIAVLAVAGLHLWKRNTLLSIFGGTAVYMVCIRFLPLLVSGSN